MDDVDSQIHDSTNVLVRQNGIDDYPASLRHLVDRRDDVWYNHSQEDRNEDRECPQWQLFLNTVEVERGC